MYKKVADSTVHKAQRKNCPHFEIEFLDMNTYTFYKIFQKFIILYCDVVCIVYVLFTRRLQIFSNQQWTFKRYYGKYMSLTTHEKARHHKIVSTEVKHR